MSLRVMPVAIVASGESCHCVIEGAKGFDGSNANVAPIASGLGRGGTGSALPFASHAHTTPWEVGFVPSGQFRVEHASIAVLAASFCISDCEWFRSGLHAHSPLVPDGSVHRVTLPQSSRPSASVPRSTPHCGHPNASAALARGSASGFGVILFRSRPESVPQSAGSLLMSTGLAMFFPPVIRRLHAALSFPVSSRGSLALFASTAATALSASCFALSSLSCAALLSSAARRSRSLAVSASAWRRLYSCCESP